MKTIPFRIVGIEVDKFSVNDSVKPNGRIDVNTNYGFAVNKQEKLIKCTVIYVYSYSGETILEMTLSCIFNIEPTAFSEMLKDDKFVIEPFFLQYLATINVGASRGEIHARCELANSEIARIILPPINLVEALPEAIEINL